MNNYRNEAREIARESTWTFFKFLPLFIIVIVILSVFFFALGGLSLFGRTVVERKVFENSFQRSESLKSQIATDEANLVEINRQLQNPNLDSNTRFNLKAQEAAARVRIGTAERKQ